MSDMLEPGAVYRALLEVQDGADPANVYQRLMGEAIDPEEAIENDLAEHAEAAHNHVECREKAQTIGLCYGFTCVYIPGGRLQVDCPCDCHRGEER